MGYIYMLAYRVIPSFWLISYQIIGNKYRHILHPSALYDHTLPICLDACPSNKSKRLYNDSMQKGRYSWDYCLMLSHYY